MRDSELSIICILIIPDLRLADNVTQLFHVDLKEKGREVKPYCPSQMQTRPQPLKPVQRMVSDIKRDDGKRLYRTIYIYIYMDHICQTATGTFHHCNPPDVIPYSACIKCTLHFPPVVILVSPLALQFLKLLSKPGCILGLPPRERPCRSNTDQAPNLLPILGHDQGINQTAHRTLRKRPKLSERKPESISHVN